MHRPGVSEMIYVCLFYHSRTLPFHLFMGELAEFQETMLATTLFSCKEGEIRVESEMPLWASVASPNENIFSLRFSDFFLQFSPKLPQLLANLILF